MSRNTTTTTRTRTPSGDGRSESALSELALPDSAGALGTEPERARRSARRVLRTVGALCALAAVGAATVPVERTVELDGRLVPEHVVAVRPLVGGLVAEVRVAAGDTVAVGDTLALLDDHALRAERDALVAERARLVAERRYGAAGERERARSAGADLARAEAAFVAARAGYRRTAAVFRFADGDTETLSEGEHVALDEARAAVAEAEAAVEAARYGGTDAWRASWHVHAARLDALDARVHDLDLQLDRLVIRAPASLSEGAVVLTEDLDRLHYARLAAGDAVLELAALDGDGTAGPPVVPLTIRAQADERQAQRVRTGMPARLTITAIPTERPRQATGRVVRVGPAPEGDASEGWRIELDPDDLAAITTSTGSVGLPTVLRSGFNVEAAVKERHETIAQTAARWIIARFEEHRRNGRVATEHPSQQTVPQESKGPRPQ